VASDSRDGGPVAALMASQKEYYDRRAPDFGDASKPDRVALGSLGPAVIRALVDEFRPEGDVLEVACGEGTFTRELLRHARSVTALDASPGMLARNRRQTRARIIRYVETDIFEWVPDRVYDAAFFSNWLSHVPPALFDRFWTLIRSCVRDDGRVGFLDEDDRAVHRDETLVIGGVPAARRTLADGTRFDIVKVFWSPDELETRIRALGWDVGIRRIRNGFLFGVARPTSEP
jgi:SAM-dependent methyltransferase